MMDSNIATVLVAAIAAFATSVVTPIVTFWLKFRQDKRIEERLVRKVDNVQTAATSAAVMAEIAESKLDNIQHVVNGRLIEAMNRISLLESLLTEIAPGDPRWERRTSPGDK